MKVIWDDMRVNFHFGQACPNRSDFGGRGTVELHVLLMRVCDSEVNHCTQCDHSNCRGSAAGHGTERVCSSGTCPGRSLRTNRFCPARVFRSRMDPSVSLFNGCGGVKGQM